MHDADSKTTLQFCGMCLPWLCQHARNACLLLCTTIPQWSEAVGAADLSEEAALSFFHCILGAPRPGSVPSWSHVLAGSLCAGAGG